MCCPVAEISQRHPSWLHSGELASFIPALGRGLRAAFACQSNKLLLPTVSETGNGWTGRETFIDMPLLLEVMPAQQSSFVVHLHLHYHRYLFQRRPWLYFTVLFVIPCSGCKRPIHNSYSTTSCALLKVSGLIMQNWTATLVQ